jgi:1,5-anhydro-D-fructose reductase (1,5-anhydro-D-mannitol-forming)
MASPVRIGMVGVGGVARLVGVAARSTCAVDIVACVASRRESAEAYAVEHGVARVHDDFESLLHNRTVDAVYLATPNALHAAQTLAAIAAGKHVLVEKPMALAIDDAVAMVEAAMQAERVLGVGYHLRHATVLRALHDRVHAGDIGEPKLIHAQWGMLLPALSGWKDDPRLAGAGALMGLGVHAVDLILWLVADRPVAVAALTTSGEGRLDRTSSYAISFEGGCLANIVVTRDHNLDSNSLSVYGSEGALHAKDALTVVAAGSLVDGGGREIATAEVDPYRAELEAFARAIRGGQPFHADGHDGTACVALTATLLNAEAHLRHPADSQS